MTKNSNFNFLRNSLLSAFCPQQEPKYEVNLCSHWLNQYWSTQVLVLILLVQLCSDNLALVH